MSFRPLQLLLTILLTAALSAAAAQRRLYYMVDTTDGVSPGLRVPLQDDLQSIVSQLLTRVNDNNSEAQHVRKQIFSRKFWKR
ncbi:hypothetical protein Y032_0008g331 [Ancylostoma ceylanicum]|uniref:Uncharacterized protein n=1 Tax=Ancylostoma ceylanicum TaxID=53326 RepID=A0A016VLD3_9BILA|nr:hypothetical protein Y032_0008g331 [Ancylostoma ceylanicum]